MGNQNYTDITALVKKNQKSKNTWKFLDMLLNWASLVVIIFAFSLLLNMSLHQQNNEKIESESPSQVLGATGQGIPRRLIIPSINVDAIIENVGLLSNGEMGVPNDIANVGWFGLGPVPGERGSAVIDGHFDGKNGEDGIFINLFKLQKGDKLYIENDKGISITYVVRESRTYDPGYADEVFNRTDGVHLNLITCNGAWDGFKKSYNERLVVFTDIIN